MRAWSLEEGQTLLLALEFRMKGLGYHVAMMATGKARLDELELLIFPNVKTEDHGNIRSLLHATEMKLRSIEDVVPKKVGNTMVSRVSSYEYGKGKNVRRVLVYFESSPIEASSTA